MKVMLAGSMGNLTFSYENWGLLARMFRRGQWISLAQTVYRIRSAGGVGVRNALSFATTGLVPRKIAMWLERRTGEDVLDCTSLHPDVSRKYDLAAKVQERRYWEPSIQNDRKRTFGLHDIGLGNAIIYAATGVDIRDPTGDKRIWEYCYGIPPEEYIVGGQTRSIARRAMKGLIPDSVRLRYKRGYQGADWPLTLREIMPEIREELARIEASELAQRMLDLPRLHFMLDHWPTGDEGDLSVASAWNLALTEGICVGSFLRRYEAAQSS